MGPDRRAHKRERAAARAAEEAKRAEAERKATAEAEKIVAIWNAAASRSAGVVVLPDDRRRRRGGLPVAELLLPGPRPVARSICARSTDSGRIDLKFNSVCVLSALLTKCSIHATGSVDR